VPGNGAYYLASGFDRIYLQPSGMVGLVGLAAEHPFLKGTLEKLGLEPRFHRRDEYKTAVNLFTETAFTDAHRRATTALMQGWLDQLVTGISVSRGLPADRVRELVDRGPFSAKEALAAGLVDRLAYADEIRGEIAGKGAERIDIGDYVSWTREAPRGRGVALVFGEGMILSGPSRYDAVSGDVTLGSDTVVKAFESAAESKDVAALVFRVNSPGGSYVASDAILRAVRKAKSAGKPVVISMGNVAASGGYMVAAYGDRVFAQPGTITGSIGVYGGKFLTREMWAKLGVTWDGVYLGNHAGLASGLRDFSDEQRALFERHLNESYDAFTAIVADGRGLDARAVEAAAGGRAWTGEDAQRLGLVDELGGLQAALAAARELGGLPPDAAVRVFPKERSLVELILEEGLGGMAAGALGDTIVRLQETLRPVLTLTATLRRSPDVRAHSPNPLLEMME